MLRGDTRPLWTDQPVIQSSRGEKRDECIRGFPSMDPCSCCAQAPTHSDSSLLDNPHTDTKRLRTFALFYRPGRGITTHWALLAPVDTRLQYNWALAKSPAITCGHSMADCLEPLYLTGHHGLYVPSFEGGRCHRDTPCVDLLPFSGLVIHPR